MDTEPDPATLAAAGWIRARTAGDLLGVGPGQVGWLVSRGHLASVTYLRDRRWLLRSEVEALVAERARWVSYADASAMIGCSTATVTKLVRQGRLHQRLAGTSAVASLGRESVEQVSRELAAKAADRDLRAAERGREAPPDDDHEWLGAAAVGELLGVTANTIRWMAQEEKVPAVKRGRRWWCRRDLALLVANARSARRLRD